MEHQASVATPPTEDPVAATSAVAVDTRSPGSVVTQPPSPNVKPTTVARARGSVTSIVTAADIDKVLLSLTPARENATSSRRSSLAVLARANSDPALRSAESSSPQTEYTRKRRRSLGLASFGQRATLDEKRKDGFLDVFGLLGIPMLFAFLFSGSAVMVQAFIQVYPNKFANALMNTSNYDDGDFWLLPETDMAPKVIATMLLAFCACCYYALAIFMLFFRHKVSTHAGKKKKKHLTSQHVIPDTDGETKTKSGDLSAIKSQFASQKKRTSFAVADVYEKFENIDGPYHAYYVSWACPVARMEASCLS